MIGRRSHDDAQSFDEAWDGRAPRDEHIAELVRVAEHLCETAATVGPSTAFRDSLRTQLMTEAATALVPLPPTPRQSLPTRDTRRPVRRRIATVTAAVVASAGAVGIVASSASAVPGEMLYPVKRSVESVELQLHRDDASRGAFQLAQASERLAEARRLNADGQSVDLIADTLDDFSDAAANGSTKLFTDYTSTGQEKSIRQVNDFAAASSVDLSELSSQLPEAAADSFAAATEAVTDLATEASVLCGDCAPANVQALVSSVTDLAKPVTAKATTRSTTPSQPAAQPTKAPSKAPSTVTSTTTPARPTPTQAAAASPAPTTATTPAPSLTDLTDPLLGGLLGNEDQVGLVPGLLGGLLGTTPKP